MGLFFRLEKAEMHFAVSPGFGICLESGQIYVTGMFDNQDASFV
jgi:hypothetical protein